MTAEIFREQAHHIFKPKEVYAIQEDILMLLEVCVEGVWRV
jgi:hypothetical protein